MNATRLAPITAILPIVLLACGGSGSDSGPGPGPDPLPPAPVTITPQLAAGTNQTCALHEDGRLKCWGDNGWGQLGLGDVENRGDEPGEMGANLPKVALGGKVQKVAPGENHTCALLTDGSVRCWGGNDYGQLGLGDTDGRGDAPGEMGTSLPAVNLGTGRTAVAIAAGTNHSCAILDNGQLKCWGDNSGGQLGLGDASNRGDAPAEMGDALPAIELGTGRTAVEVAAGYQHTCARLDDGTMKCWGWDGLGQLGLGDSATHGDQAGEMGDALPTVKLGTGRTVRQIDAANRHTCALLDDGTVKCWGHAYYGQLGTGDTNNRGDEPGEMGNHLLPIALGTGRTAVSVRTSMCNTCAVLDDGTVKCWGDNAYGALGLGDTIRRGDGPGEMGDALRAVPLGSGRTAVEVAPGFLHTCALLDDGSVKCWGHSGIGQLGLGDTTNRGDEPGEMANHLPPVELAW